MKPASLILASQSPRRRELLRRIRREFAVEPCPIPEPQTPPAADRAAAWAESQAYFKAAAVAETHRGCWVLGADTIVTCDGSILGKPADIHDARRMLTLQAGRPSEVITGIALLRIADETTRVVDHEITRVWMRDDPAFILSYLQSERWRGKAGAYGIQDAGDALIDRIDGSFDNVVGLPTERLTRLFEELGI